MIENDLHKIDPFATGHLSVGDGNEIYWEACGNPQGKPALYLHGGPGSGITESYRQYFNPEKYLIVSFEQRGCGRSRPLVTDEGADLSTNTTQALISDIEELRTHLGISAWLVCGVSWGTTLALAYAESYPDKVTGMLLMAVTTTSIAEIEWITEDMGRVFPREWDAFAHAVQPKEGERLIDAYYAHVTGENRVIREQVAKAWCDWEDVHVSLDPNHSPSERFRDPAFRLLFATLVIHYWKHAGFGGDDILANIHRIAHIPGVLIHGRLDVSSPLVTPLELHKVWPNSKLIVIDGDGHGGKTMADQFAQELAQFQ